MSPGPLPCRGDQPCPCARVSANGKALPFAACCGQYLEGEAPTPTPDAASLMRSRYSAFVLQREAYLLATWHASTRPATLAFDTDGKWLGLQVRSAQVLDAEHAQVEFVARFKPARAPAWRLHERSRFVLENGRWYYLDGVQLP